MPASVQDIPAHAQIDIGECGERWCAASWRNIDGWVRVETIAANDAPLEGPPPRPVVVRRTRRRRAGVRLRLLLHRRW